MSYCQRGRELLQDLQRSDFLPAFDEDGARVVLQEIEDLYGKINRGVESEDQQHYYSVCLKRLSKLRSLRWEAGPILPEDIAATKLSENEKNYFRYYSDILADYCEAVDMDLFQDLEPPKELLIEVRVLHDCGEIMTDNGPVNLTKGTTHYLRRTQIEDFIRQGRIEHIQSDAL